MLIPAVLDAIEERLATVAGLNLTDNPDVAPVAPMALVDDGEMRYHATFGRGLDELDVSVTVYVPKGSSSSGFYEARLFKSGYGDKSILKAFETALTAGDDVPNATFTIDRCTTDAGSIDGETYIVLRFDGTVQVPGKAS